MSEFGYLILFSFIGGVASLVGGIGLLIWKDKLMKFDTELTSFAAGVMLTVALLDMVPEAIENGEVKTASWFVLIGIMFLFLLEKTSLWFHHHHEPHGHQPKMVGVWLGDTLHNFTDGLAIGASFLFGQPAGIATALAVGAHELPHEMADFSLYIKAGYSRLFTLFLNVFSSMATMLGAILVYKFGAGINGLAGAILGLAGGMFLYVALADLIPELHMETSKKSISRQLFFFFFGTILMVVTLRSLGH